MKAEFQARFLLYVARRNTADQGFTLIELLVVIIIIGILSAIALPSFLNQANKAKQAEARQNLSAMNRAQQAYYLENYAFSSTVENLGLGIQTQSVNYQYSINGAGENSNDTTTFALNTAQSLKKPLRHYVGRAELGTVLQTSEATTLTILCESLKIQADQASAPGGVLINDCGANYRKLDAR